MLVLRSRRALRRLLWAPGELGLARAYVTGDLDVEGDLADGFRRAWALAGSAAHVRRRLERRRRGCGRRALAAAARRASGCRRSRPQSEARLSGGLHTRLRDRAAIAHHYDLSNDFYELLLDESMAYSCGLLHARRRQSLADAQRAKLDLICRKLDLRPGMRLLDVGCGWGSLILHAAEHYGVHATGITLSAQQRDFVAKRVADRGLTDRVEVRLQDYRELAETGEPFDAVALDRDGRARRRGAIPGVRRQSCSRAAARAVGCCCSRCRGTADAAPGGGAFIESYIAPDMHMRPLSARRSASSRRAGFEVRDVEAMREHYVRTVRALDRHVRGALGRVRRAASARRSPACGGCTWSAARWLSRRAGWASTRSWPSADRADEPATPLGGPSAGGP